MKRSDIPLRKAVAYKARKYSNIEPAYVLDVGTLWTYSRSFGDEPRKWATSTAKKFTAGHGFYSDRNGDDGFLTVVIHAGRFAPPERNALMREVEALIAELWEPGVMMADDVREFESKLPSDTWLGVVNNVRLVGEWLPALEAQTAERRAKDEEREAERVKREKFRDLVAVIEAEAEERGFETWRIHKENGGRISLPASMLAKMLGIEMPEA